MSVCVICKRSWSAHQVHIPGRLGAGFEMVCPAKRDWSSIGITVVVAMVCVGTLVASLVYISNHQ